MRTDVNTCDCTRGHRKRVFTESWLWEKNPLPHRGIDSASAACRSDALPTELHPHPTRNGTENYAWSFKPRLFPHTLSIGPPLSRLVDCMMIWVRFQRWNEYSLPRLIAADISRHQRTCDIDYFSGFIQNQPVLRSLAVSLACDGIVIVTIWLAEAAGWIGSSGHSIGRRKKLAWMYLTVPTIRDTVVTLQRLPDPAERNSSNHEYRAIDSSINSLILSVSQPWMSYQAEVLVVKSHVWLTGQIAHQFKLEEEWGKWSQINSKKEKKKKKKETSNELKRQKSEIQKS